MPKLNLPDDAVKFLGDLAPIILNAKQADDLPNFCFFHDKTYWKECPECFGGDSLNGAFVNIFDKTPPRIEDILSGQKLTLEHLDLISRILWDLYAVDTIPELFQRLPNYELVITVDHAFFRVLHKTTVKTLLPLYHKGLLEGHMEWIRDVFPVESDSIEHFLEDLEKQSPDPTFRNLVRLTNVYVRLLSLSKQAPDPTIRIFQEHLYPYFLKLVKFHPLFWKRDEASYWITAEKDVSLRIDSSSYKLTLDKHSIYGETQELLHLCCNIFEDIPFGKGMHSMPYGLWVQSNRLHLPHYHCECAQVPALVELLKQFLKENDMDLFLQRKDVCLV